MKMHLTLTLALILSLGLIGFALGQDVDDAGKDGADDDASAESSEKDDGEEADDEALERSIDDLGSASFEVREKAMQTLRDAGEGAIPLLEKAKEHADPEVRWRAGALRKAMRNETRQGSGPQDDPREFARRFLEFGNLDLDGDGKPDIQIDFPDVEGLRKQMLENHKALREQMDRMRQRRLPSVRIPRFELDFGNGRARGFRVQTNPDGSVTMEKLEGGRWVPANERSRRAYGMKLAAPGEALRAQLSIPKGTGLLVEEAEEDGDAAKSGLQKYDIILTVNGEKVTAVSDFEEKMGETPEGEDARLEVIRKAEKVTVELPVKRLRKL